MTVQELQVQYDTIQSKIALLIVDREKIYIRLVEAIENKKNIEGSIL